MYYGYGARTDWEEVDIIWTLEISYLGDDYRFASITIDLVDIDGKTYPYVGGLEDVVISTS